MFFPTARAAQFHAALARAAGCNCLDLHSRLSQNKRDQAAAAFGSNPTGVMFASDVIARGLDFPDVSLVVQVGRLDCWVLCLHTSMQAYECVSDCVGQVQ